MRLDRERGNGARQPLLLRLRRIGQCGGGRAGRGQGATRRRRSRANGSRSPPPAETGEWPGASISADGSTVAWMGEEIAQQAATLPGETLEPNYTEPLWRRIAPGSETPTERVTGGSDPGNPACAASGESALAGRAVPRGSLPGAVRGRTGSRAPAPGSGARAGGDRRLHPAAQRRRLHGRVRLRGAARSPRASTSAGAATGSRATCTSPTCTPASRASRRSRR